MRNGNLLKSRVSEIWIKQIRVNQGVGVLSICAHKLYNVITLLTLLALESTLSRRSGATKVHMRKMDDLGRRCCQGLKIVLPQSVTQRRCLSQFQSLYHPPARVRTQCVEADINKKSCTAWKGIPYTSSKSSLLAEFSLARFQLTWFFYIFYMYMYM